VRFRGASTGRYSALQRINKNFAVFRTIRGPHDPAALHRFYNSRGPVVAKLQFALEP
jgi:hypothetical protein